MLIVIRIKNWPVFLVITHLINGWPYDIGQHVLSHEHHKDKFGALVYYVGGISEYLYVTLLKTGNLHLLMLGMGSELRTSLSLSLSLFFFFSLYCRFHQFLSCMYYLLSWSIFRLLPRETDPTCHGTFIYWHSSICGFWLTLFGQGWCLSLLWDTYSHCQNDMITILFVCKCTERR